MMPLRTKLQSVPNWFWILLILTVVQFFYRYFLFPSTSVYIGDETEFYGTVVEVIEKEYGKKVTFQDKELLTGYVSKDTLVEVGDVVYASGSLQEIRKETIPNLFSYKQYARSRKEFYQIDMKNIEVMKRNGSISSFLYSQIRKAKKSSPYLSALLLQNKDSMEESILTSYQINSIMHLFAISGLHITFFMKRFRSIYGKLIVLLLCFFLFSKNVSFLRAGIFFFLTLFLKERKELLGLVSVLLLLWINPYYVDQSAFWYTASISLFLSFTRRKRKTMMFPRLTTCFLIWVISLPIQLNTVYELNLLAPICNFLLTPIFVCLLLPLLLLTFFFPILDEVTYFVIQGFEHVSLFLSHYCNLTWIVGKPNLILLILLCILLGIFVYHFLNHKKWIFIDILVLVFLFFIPKQDEVTFLDVSQADATFLSLNGHSVLIDVSKNKGKQLVSFLKSKGVQKLDYLILTHGDSDHMGGSIYLVNNFQVEHVVFNCGEYNDLEQELMEVLKKENVNYSSCVKKLNLGKYQLEFLNTSIYDDENENSSVIFLNYHDYEFLFMGDAGIKREKDILKKYRLPNIDFLKVGHHGSNTSSSEEFIDTINPKYSFISVGLNNRYHHPKKSVLDILNNSKIYRTDIDGSIEIRLNKNGYRISTCPP